MPVSLATQEKVPASAYDQESVANNDDQDLNVFYVAGKQLRTNYVIIAIIHSKLFLERSCDHIGVSDEASEY